MSQVSSVKHFIKTSADIYQEKQQDTLFKKDLRDGDLVNKTGWRLFCAYIGRVFYFIIGKRKAQLDARYRKIVSQAFHYFAETKNRATQKTLSIGQVKQAVPVVSRIQRLVELPLTPTQDRLYSDTYETMCQTLVTHIESQKQSESVSQDDGPYVVRNLKPLAGEFDYRKKNLKQLFETLNLDSNELKKIDQTELFNILLENRELNEIKQRLHDFLDQDLSDITPDMFQTAVYHVRQNMLKKRLGLTFCDLDRMTYKIDKESIEVRNREHGRVKTRSTLTSFLSKLKGYFVDYLTHNPDKIRNICEAQNKEKEFFGLTKSLSDKEFSDIMDDCPKVWEGLFQTYTVFNSEQLNSLAKESSMTKNELRSMFRMSLINLLQVLNQGSYFTSVLENKASKCGYFFKSSMLMNKIYQDLNSAKFKAPQSLCNVENPNEKPFLVFNKYHVINRLIETDPHATTPPAKFTICDNVKVNKLYQNNLERLKEISDVFD